MQGLFHETPCVARFPVRRLNGCEAQNLAALPPRIKPMCLIRLVSINMSFVMSR